jgi:hypothetical protein
MALSIHRSIRRLAGLVALALALSPALVKAQTSPRTKVWYGTRLVESEPEALPEPLPVPRVSGPAKADLERLPPVTINVAAPDPGWGHMAALMAEQENARRLGQLERDTESMRRQLAEQTAIRRASAEQPVPARLPESALSDPKESPPATVKVESASRGQPTFSTVVLTQMAAIVGSIVVLTVLFFGTHLLLARRGGGLGSLFRVELVGAGVGGHSQAYAEAELVPPEPMPEPWGEAQPNFEIGPTYEEEKLQREEAERNKEKAVLQQIFEMNQKIQEEIHGQQPAATH